MPTELTLMWRPNVTDMKLGLALGSWGTRGRLLRTLFLLFAMPGLLFGVFLGSVGQGVGAGLLLEHSSCLRSPLSSRECW